MVARTRLIVTLCAHFLCYYPLGTMHSIYRTDVPLLPTVRFYIVIQQIYLIIFFRISLAIFVYSSTKCRVFPNVTLLGS
jgi:hypothetical protein